MDLNELLHAHQVAVMRASAEGDDATRDDHYAKVAEYAERVRRLRDWRNLPQPERLAEQSETIIYGTYAGDPSQPAAEEAVGDWEDEGGALNPPQVTVVPDGISTRVVRHYHVGPYVYQDLDLAVAEHLRQLSADNDMGKGTDNDPAG